MSKNKDFLTREEVQAQTGWSLSFIDRRLPRIKVGGKVLIPVSDLERLLKGERIDG